jgi:hypothetical protein
MRMAITDRVLFAESASQALGGASHHLLAGSQVRTAVKRVESREHGSTSHEHGIIFLAASLRNAAKVAGKSESSLAPDEL